MVTVTGAKLQKQNEYKYLYVLFFEKINLKLLNSIVVNYVGVKGNDWNFYSRLFFLGKWTFSALFAMGTAHCELKSNQP